ncbi:MAG: bifunctional homocysteine S-methyltransferase/methylenetetrahydrofolate reductase, partial [Oscillospiraceae bacterium]|nr:bifunctional homocysteine S-methyltransferase/methylenetetrahydrofolate reductase [Oscillospiraceae bacterium]
PVLSEEALENLKKSREELSGWILGGIIPVISHRNAVFMNNEINGITVSREIIDRYEGLERKEAEDLAVEISAEIAEKIRPYIDGYYLMTPMRRISLMERVLKVIGEAEKRR